VALAAFAAAGFGPMAIRATGTYFLMITLALGMVVWGPRLLLPAAFFYFALVAAGVAWAPLGLLVSSPFGLGLKGIRESESRMRALGYNVWLHKYVAFVVAGFAGVLWAYFNGFVAPTDVQLLTSVETLLMVALGGPGTLAR
jgi:branched-chain amino acid transport system permease protein